MSLYNLASFYFDFQRSTVKAFYKQTQVGA